MEEKELLRQLAHQAMFSIADDEMETMLKAFHVFLKHVESLQTIDTTGIDIMAFPYDIETTFLREDVIQEPRSQDEILKNAPQIQDKQIKVPKVI